MKSWRVDPATSTRYRLVRTASGGGLGGGGAELLEGEANGWATDFLDPVDAQRVALKTADVVVESGLSFYQNSSTSPKMIYDINGVLGWSPHNMVLQSAMGRVGFNWTGNGATFLAGQPDPMGGNEALEVTTNTPGAGLNVAQGVNTLTIGQTYTGSMWLKGTPGEQVFFNSNGNIASSQVLVTFTGQWQRISSSFIAPTTGAYLTAELDDRGAGPNLPNVVFYCWGAQFQRGPVATAYFPTTTAIRYGLALDYDPITHDPKGLLGEPVATNILVQSAIGRPGFVMSGNGGLRTGGKSDPAGGLEAAEVVITAGDVGAGLNIGSPVVVTNGTTYIDSAWCKGPAGQKIYFNAAGPATQVLVTFTGAWQRVATAPYVGVGALTYFGFETYNRSGGGHLPAVTFQCWGGQVEAGTVPTSYIPTYAATATRAANIYKITPAQINYSATAGSWWAEVEVLRLVAAGQDRIIANSANHAPIYLGNGTCLFYDGQTLSHTTTPNIGIYKIECAFQEADRAICARGVTPTLNTVAGMASGTPGAEISFFSTTTGAQPAHSYLRKLRYLPRRPSNAEMQTQTQADPP